ncbi:hypothetical protein [Kytococcus sp. HMSC28H12]|uniref:hypothetical protein n=1 Tax=Kytococcus TaxID=57499 RepID=UPI0008C76318|nr:hypothetical protein [Kytococcus sp. HMSC28H12]OFS14660.1 hypothetical protein HMPREF3099_03585 [Kytococcus sp. HMSC28H12]
MRRSALVCASVVGLAACGPQPTEDDAVQTAAAFFERVDRGDGDAASGITRGGPQPIPTTDAETTDLYRDLLGFPDGDCELADDWEDSEVDRPEDGRWTVQVHLRLTCDGESKALTVPVVERTGTVDLDAAG